MNERETNVHLSHCGSTCKYGQDDECPVVLSRKNTSSITITIEKAGSNYSAYSPDIDGCIATDKTIPKTIKRYAEALEFHLEGIKLGE